MTENQTCLLLKGMWDFPPVLHFYFSSHFHLEMNCFEAEDPHINPIFAALCS